MHIRMDFYGRFKLDSSRFVFDHVCSHITFLPILLIETYSMTTERYRAWLQLLVDGNQNMVRIWGGGIYEHDDFYNICDGRKSF